MATTTRLTHGRRNAIGDGSSALITLTTDFGEGSPYIAAMKGVIAGRAPGAEVVDATHSVPPFDLAAGAFLVWAATSTFPPASIHVAVVDPGVGTDRRRVAFRTAAGSFYVGPDNGVFSTVIAELGVAAAVVLRRPRNASRTFEGRDVFAPAAAALAAGAELDALGTPAGDLVRLPRQPDSVIWVDNFGNLVTNLAGPASPLRVGRHDVHALAETFAAATTEGPFVYVGSLGFLEIGVREGRADEALASGRGARVSRIEQQSPP